MLLRTLCSSRRAIQDKPAHRPPLYKTCDFGVRRQRRRFGSRSGWPKEMFLSNNCAKAKAAALPPHSILETGKTGSEFRLQAVLRHFRSFMVAALIGTWGRDP